MTYPDSADLEGLREFAVNLAREAGELTLTYFRGTFDVERKADETPVTRADRESEQLIRDRIQEAYPEDGILGEEFDAVAGTGKRTWVVDPIDGTQSFVAGVPLYAVLIALVDGAYNGEEIETSRVLLGVIHIPPLGETLSAARGLGAHWQRGPACVSSREELAGARVCTTDFADLHRRQPELAARINDRASFTRTWGDAYGYLLLATGRIDAMIDPIVSPWDIAPLPVIVEEAGGRFTDLHGRAVLGESAIATNGRIHASILHD